MILDFSFEQVMRLSSIKRWGVIEMSQSQSVAEHSYNVAMISAMLVDQLPNNIKPAGLREYVINWALVHDLPELVTGDIPTSVKDHIGDDVKEMERRLFPKMFEYKSGVGQLALVIVKLADLIEAAQFAGKFCTDTRKNNILAEIMSKINLLVIEITPPSLIKPIHAAVQEIWKDGKIS